MNKNERDFQKMIPFCFLKGFHSRNANLTSYFANIVSCYFFVNFSVAPCLCSIVTNAFSFTSGLFKEHL